MTAALFIRCLLFCFSFLASSAHAEPFLKMAIIYPGGEGSMEDADPVISEFFRQIKQHGGPSMEGKYYNDAREGISAVKKNAADLGIVSFDFFMEHRSAVPMQAVLATQSSATGKSSELFYALAAQKNAAVVKILYTSRALSKSFIQKWVLAPSPHWTIQATNAPLTILRKIGEGDSSAALLVDSYEYASVRKLKFPWVKNLNLLSVSREVPTSLLVAFKPIPEAVKSSLIRTLIQLPSKNEGREVLDQLRLKGFEQVKAMY